MVEGGEIGQDTSLFLLDEAIPFADDLARIGCDLARRAKLRHFTPDVVIPEYHENFRAAGSGNLLPDRNGQTAGFHVSGK
jgi:hypothetical protein